MRCATCRGGTVTNPPPPKCAIIQGWSRFRPQVQFHLLFLFIMTFSRDLMLGMLRRGSNGEQLLEILDLIVAERENQVEVQDETEADIQF